MHQHLETLDALWAPAQNPYFRWLADPGASRDDFVETQIQFHFAVVYFSRPMAALAARLEDAALRLVLLDNVADEHGRGSPGDSHEATFLQLLGRFGVTREAVERRALWPEVQAFNHALSGGCLTGDPLAALATLGMIERLFASASGQLGAAIVKQGWLTPSEVVHYAVHERLDLAHSAGLLRPLAAPWAADARARDQIRQGLSEGAYLLMRLYEDLHRHRTERREREATGARAHAGGWQG